MTHLTLLQNSKTFEIWVRIKKKCVPTHIVLRKNVNYRNYIAFFYCLEANPL